MKTTILSLFCLLFFAGAALSQAVVGPGTLDLPRTASLPNCTAANKGRMIYTSTGNKLYYCNGTAWINSEVAGPQSEAAFSATFTITDGFDQNFQVYDEGTYVNFNTEFYDVSNNFFTAAEMNNSNTFIAPVNGVYHFDASASWYLGSATLGSSSTVTIQLMVTTANGASTTVGAEETFAAVKNDNFDVLISRDLKLAAGEKVSLSVSDGVGGSSHYLKSDMCSLNGHLVTKW